MNITKLFFLILSLSIRSGRSFLFSQDLHRISKPPKCNQGTILKHPLLRVDHESKSLLRAANDDKLMIDAALNGRVLDVRKLLDSGVDPDSKDEYECTALLHACFFGHEEIVNLLLQRKANVNAETKQGNTALRIACDNGRVAVAQLLIDNNADVNVRNEYGETALHEASSQGRDEIVRFLLENKADVDVRNQNGETALHKACVSGALDCVALLLDNNASYTAMNIWGETPVDIANAGATENPNNRNFFQIFHMLSNYVKTKETEKQEQLLERLSNIEAKADVNITSQVEGLLNAEMESISRKIQNIVDENTAIRRDATMSIDQSRSNTQALNELKQTSEKNQAESVDRISMLEGKMGSGMVGLVTSVVQSEQKPLSDQIQKIMNENKSLMDQTTSSLQQIKALDVASYQNKINNIERVINGKMEEDKAMFNKIKENIEKINAKTIEEAGMNNEKITKIEKLVGEGSAKESDKVKGLIERLQALEGKMLNDANFSQQKISSLEKRLDAVGQQNVGNIEKKLEAKSAEDSGKMNDLNQRLRVIEEKGNSDLGGSKEKISVIEQSMEQKKQQDTEVFAGILSRIKALEEKMTKTNTPTEPMGATNGASPAPPGSTFTERIRRVATHLGIQLEQTRPVLDQIASIEQVVHGQQREGLLVARVTSLEQQLGL